MKLKRLKSPWALLLTLLGVGLCACRVDAPPPSVIRLGELLDPAAMEGMAATQDLAFVQDLTLEPEEATTLDVEIDASRLTRIELRARGPATMLRFDWRLAGEGRFKPYRSLSFPLLGQPEDEVYELSLRREPYWSGRINRLRMTAQGGGVRILEAVARPAASVYREMALKGLSMPALPGLSRWTVTLPEDPPPQAIFETHVGLVPEYHRPGVVARFRVYTEDGTSAEDRRELWAEHVVQGQKRGRGGEWQVLRTQVAPRPGARLVLEVSSEVDGRPLPEGVAVWGNPILLPQPPTQPSEVRNLLIVVIDTLRADVLGAYGDPMGLTPNLDALAARSIRLTGLHAPAPWTLPSVASLMTGLQPQTHGAGRRLEGFAPTGLPETCQTLAEVLGRQGYFTSALYHNIYLSPAFGLQQGFDRYASYEEKAESLVDRALEQLGELKDRPWFLYLHLFDPHTPYQPPPAECRQLVHRLQIAESPGCVGDRRLVDFPPDPSRRSWMEALYRAEVAYTDGQMGRLLAGLDELGLSDRTVLAVVSDHGEEFWHRLDQEQTHGYHADADHGHTHYRELLHLVGLIRIPGQRPRTVRSLVEMVDLYPTLLRLLDLEPSANQGRDLAPGFAGESLASVSLLSDSLLYGRPRWAVQRGRWKLVAPHDPAAPGELYDLRSDPGETVNLAAEHADLVAELQQLGRAKIKARTEARRQFHNGDLSSSATYLEWRHITKLRALGYLR